MAFHHELKKGLTVEEAVLVITGLSDNYHSFQKAVSYLIEDMAIQEAQYGKGSANSSDYIVFNIKDALLTELKIACSQLRAAKHKSAPPKITTPIELLIEDEFNDQLDSIAMTKESIARWFYESDASKFKTLIPVKTIKNHHEFVDFRFLEDETNPRCIEHMKDVENYILKRCELLDPTKNYLLSNKDDPFEEGNMNPNFFLTLGLYRECWKELPAGMRNPDKSDLEKYIKSTMNIRDTKQIDAMIVLASPKGYKFKGGRKVDDKNAWKPKKSRDDVGQ